MLGTETIFFSSIFFFNSVPFEKLALRDFRLSVLSSTVHQLDKKWVQNRFFFFFVVPFSSSVSTIRQKKKKSEGSAFRNT